MAHSFEVPPASTFIVRFWRDGSTEESRWRGQIQHVQSGESAAFLSPEGMLDFVQGVGVMVGDRKQPGAGELLSRSGRGSRAG